MKGERVMTEAGDSVRAIVDRRKCTGYGICNDICSEVFKLDGQGFAYADGPVPPELEELAREAAGECPTEAITVVRGSDEA